METARVLARARRPTQHLPTLMRAHRLRHHCPAVQPVRAMATESLGMIW